MSSVLVAIALLACMVVLVIRYRKKEEELEVQEERLTEVILENRDLKAATDSDEEGYYQFVQGESKKSGISKNMATTTLKSIRKRKSWCVLENSA